MRELLLQVSSVSLRFGDRELFSEVNLSLNKSELVALIGENGTGKSSLIQLVTGHLNPTEGCLMLNQRPLDSYSIEELSRFISVVFTSHFPSMNMRVKDVVAIGRTPYLSWLGNLSSKDEQLVKQALNNVGVFHLLDKELHTLSDGERQRVMIAKALAQDTPLIVLDEPTAHLDVKNRVLLLKLLRDIAKNTGKTILMSTHELEITLKLADKTWLITNNKIIENTPEDLVMNDSIRQAFVSENISFNNEKGVFDIFLDTDKEVSLVGGNDIEGYWYSIVLKKYGYKVIESAKTLFCIDYDGGWKFEGKQGRTVSDLVVQLSQDGTKFE